MEIGDSPEEAAFRAEARAWLEQHATRLDDDAASPQGSYGASGLQVHMDRSRDWQRTLYEEGWAGLTLPKEHGGRRRTRPPPAPPHHGGAGVRRGGRGRPGAR